MPLDHARPLWFYAARLLPPPPPQGARCSLVSRKVYADAATDYTKMFLINIPGIVLGSVLVYCVDKFTGLGACPRRLHTRFAALCCPAAARIATGPPAGRCGGGLSPIVVLAAEAAEMVALPSPYNVVALWSVALPCVALATNYLTSLAVKDFIILKARPPAGSRPRARRRHQHQNLCPRMTGPLPQLR